MAPTDLPLEIIRIILLNLPAKSLLRFKTVCKPWDDIISDRQFAKDQQKLKNSMPQNLFLGYNLRKQLCLFEFDNVNVQVKAVLQQQQSGEVCCYGDGIVLLRANDMCYNSLERQGRYVLWSPSIRKHVTFTCPYGRIFDDEPMFGLCHDRYLDDYKVVIKKGVDYAVFSCKDKSWTRKQDVQFRYRFYPKAGLLVGGFSFWCLYEARLKTGEIIYFDPRDDNFKKLGHKPKPLERIEAFFLTSLGSRLCSYDYNISRKLEIWVMEGHVDSCSWSKLLNIETPEAMFPFPIVHPMFFTQKNEGRLVIMGEYIFIFYSPQEKNVEYFRLDGVRLGVDCSTSIIPYPDSLFFPDCGVDEVDQQRHRTGLI